MRPERRQWKAGRREHRPNISDAVGGWVRGVHTTPLTHPPTPLFTPYPNQQTAWSRDRPANGSLGVSFLSPFSLLFFLLPAVSFAETFGNFALQCRFWIRLPRVVPFGATTSSHFIHTKKRKLLRLIFFFFCCWANGSRTRSGAQ